MATSATGASAVRALGHGPVLCAGYGWPSLWHPGAQRLLLPRPERP